MFMDSKICKRCNIEKPLSEFYKQQQKGKQNQIWYYYDSYCKICRGCYATERRRKLKIQAIEYKGGKCADCGYDDMSHPEVFDFHHENPEEKDFAIFETAKKFSSVISELDKCILLCANCHRIRHREERGY